MAPGTSALGGLVAAAVCVALAVAGCGGGSSSSAPATAGGTVAKTATAKQSTNPSGAEGGGPSGATNNEAPEQDTDGKQPEQSGGGNSEKKHPPLELPNGQPEKGPSKTQEAEAPTSEIALRLPGGVTTANTCQGENSSPEISWQGVPPGAVELMVFAVNVRPVEETLYFNWAIAGLDPNLTGLKEGEVPPGAILGRTGSGKNGYSLCPEGSKKEDVIFSVYALTKSLSPEQGFDPLSMHTEAGAASEVVGLTNAFVGG